MTAIGHGRRNRFFLRAWVLAAGALFALSLVPHRVAAQLSEQVLYSFCPQGSFCGDGAYPEARLLMDAAGNLYGTAVEGALPLEDFGVVFELSPTDTGWRETVLHTFACIDRCNGAPTPKGGVVMDAAGNLYGTAFGGGASGFEGFIFKLSPNPIGGWTYSLLYGFCPQAGCADGANPSAGLIADSAGNLYGTTSRGGAGNQGVVFALAPDGTESVLYNFCSLPDCTDGARPVADLIIDAAGNLYGTTVNGGAANQGVVFVVAPDGTETVLYSFCQQAGCTDGANPRAGLVMDAAGNLFGTTYVGGVFNQGVLFKLAPDGTETVLGSGGPYAANPAGDLLIDAAGNLYGTTQHGGAADRGVAFEFAADGTASILHSFSGADGAFPVAGLIMDAAGILYGTTDQGGATNRGVVFALTPAPASATLAPPQRR